MVNVFEKDNNLTYLSLEEILTNIDQYNIEQISFVDHIDYVSRDQENINSYYINEENPVAYGSNINGHNTLFISRDYYLNNKALVDKILTSLVSRISSEYFRITSDELSSNRDIIASLLANQSISDVTLNGIQSIFLLNPELLEMVKQNEHIKRINTKGVTEELAENFDSVIGYNNRYLFDFYKHDDLVSLKNLSINNIENMDDAYNLKYLNPEAEITIKDSNFPFIEFFSIYNSLNKENHITINITDKNRFNSILFANKDLLLSSNIDVFVDNDSYAISTYMEYEERLYKLIEPALTLSPLERYLYAYNIVKQFKPYKEDENDKGSSRNIYEILDNDFMVCVGYAKLLVDLLDKLGIQSQRLSVSINIGMDQNENVDMVAHDNSTVWGGHERIEVKIEDPKYGVNGIYTADPTWDNSLKHDLYNHALLTKEEANLMSRQNFMNLSNEVFDANSLEEFYQMANFVLDRYESKEKEMMNNNIARTTKKLQEKTLTNITYNELVILVNECLKEKYDVGNSNFMVGDYDRAKFIIKLMDAVVDSYEFKNAKTPEEIKNVILNKCDKVKSELLNNAKKPEIKLIGNLLDYIKKFNNPLYENIISMYPMVISSKAIGMDKEDLYHIIEIIGKYIVSVNNNKVEAQTLYQAVLEVYQAAGLSADEIKTKMEDTIAINEKAYNFEFPTLRRINPDGSETIYQNEENKFSEEKSRTR